jgi:polyvinyl alcohol dehydrogenase (cytochrome)
MKSQVLASARAMRLHPLAWVSFLPFVAASSTCSTKPAPVGGGGSGGSTPAQPDCSADVTDWPMAGQNVCNTRTQKTTTISPQTAPQLTLKWSFDAPGDVSATPAVVAGSVYVPDWGGNLNRIDAASGKATWSKSVGTLANFVDSNQMPVLNLVSRTTPVISGNNVIIGTQRNAPQIVTDPRPNAFLIAVDKDSGAAVWNTPLHEGHPAAVITGSPVLDGTRLYVGVASLEEAFGLNPSYTCCSFRGSVAAVDATTGKLIWQTHTIEDSIYFKPDGTTKSGYAGNSVWSSTPVVDRKRKSLYVTTGNTYTVPAGVTTVESGNHVDSIMALDLDTGAIKWARSLHTLDIWTFTNMAGPDADFGCGANLFTATIGGEPKDLVGAGQKNGVYTALDADTGAIVWQTTVGPGGHLGGIHWGTAVDGQRLYVGVNNESATPFALGGSGKQAGTMCSVGAWAALDPATGAILWQVANPASPKVTGGVSVNGPVTVVGGVLFGGSMDPAGNMYALDASTGDVLWSYTSGGTVYGGPAVVGGVVYWGAGYSSGRLGFGTSIKKLFAFSTGP